MARKTSRYATGPVGGPMTEYRVYHATQCKSEDTFHQAKCQGVHGHKGPHWSYGPNGWLHRWQRKKDIKSKWDWASSSTPPGHPEYPDPEIQTALYYKNFDRREVVGTKRAEPVSKRTAKLLKEHAKHARKRKVKGGDA